jgi:hypothetical protein
VVAEPRTGDLRGICYSIIDCWSSSGTSHEGPSTAAQCRIWVGHGPMSVQARLLSTAWPTSFQDSSARSCGSGNPSSMRSQAPRAGTPASRVAGIRRAGCKRAVERSSALPVSVQGQLQGYVLQADGRHRTALVDDLTLAMTMAANLNGAVA